MTTKIRLFEHFAHRATLDGDNLSQHLTGARILSQIQQRTGIGRPGKELVLQRNSLTISLLSYSRLISNVPLQRLGYLQQVLELLQESMNGLSIALNIDPLDALLKPLGKLHQRLLISHQNLFEPSSFAACLEYLEGYSDGVGSRMEGPPPLRFGASDKSKFDAYKSRRVQEAFEETMYPSLQRLHNAAMSSQFKRTACAQAWITFFIGCLGLYLPNRVYDPAARKVVYQTRFKQQQQRIQRKADALEVFDEAHSIGIPSFRYQLAKKELVELGNIPEVDHVFRPEIPQIGGLQGEFSNILESIVGPASILGGSAPSDKKPIRRSEILLLRQNIGHSIRRLTSNHRAYDDLSRPVVGFLRGLDVGLALHLLEDTRETHKQETTKTIIQLTPLLGLTCSSLTHFDISNYAANPHLSLEFRVRYLQLTSLALIIDHQTYHVLAGNVLDIFRSYYNEWRHKLQLDKDKHNVGSSLYQYRGLKDDKDTIDPLEYPDLFPELDSVRPTEATVGLSAIDLNTLSSQEVAALHQKIFVQKQQASELILSMIQQSSDDISVLWQGSDDLTIIPVTSSDMLSGVLLNLDRASKEVVPQCTRDKTYRFYTDINVNELQKLVTLLKRIQLRFRDIQSIWPEHATLTEILKETGELMDLPFCEPIAKVLIKAEQLHSFIYEWQIVASREYTASDVYNDLTALLVSWRQLELSTWAGLLEAEDLKCKNEAQSWWFLAFEVTIVAPLEVIDSEKDLKTHAQELAQSLGEFLADTPLGQYQERLEILERLRDHIQLLIIKHPSMHLVCTVLVNVIRYYTRYVPSIRAALAKGRSDLEKDVKEVMLLATWKDTNITALRESSRRSRTRLLKVIRKYRTLLAQPVSTVSSFGLPEIQNGPSDIKQFSRHDPISLLPKAIHMCTEKLATWTLKPAHLTQAQSTAQKIALLSTAPATAIDAGGHVHSFLADLAESVKSLRKETPSEATEDNKPIVKHLKNRKRRLLAETLRTLRLMGFRPNPGPQLLEKQAILHVVLANSPSLYSTFFDTDYAEHCFDKSLDNISSIRSMTTTQNEDLTSKEASRCLGYLESILSTTLAQRRLLASSFSGIGKLDSIVEVLSGLWRSDFEELQRKGESNMDSQLERKFRWLIHLIEAACKVITTHDQMAKTDTSIVISTLNHWKDMFKELIASADQSVTLPQGLSSKHHRAIGSRMLEALRNFGKSIEKEESNHPAMKFILTKLRLWAGEPKTSLDKINHIHLVEPSILDEKLSNTIISVLASAQQVQQSLSKHPISFDQLNWLAETDNVIGESLQSLRIKAVAGSLETLSNMIQFISIEGPDGIQLAAAMCTVPAPILYQYLDTAKDMARRYLMLHQACCSMLCTLTTIYKQIALDGFCSPREKTQKSDQNDEKLQDGTGLGEGEGAENISKDVGDDEDLSELAAQKAPAVDERDETQGQDDAVDMQNNELEGEISDGSKDESQDDQSVGDGDDDAEIDEETGSVSDLNPTAVDEKLWNEAASTRKEKETKKRGGEKEDELTAKDGRNEAGEENLSGSEDDEAAGAAEDEKFEHQEPEEVDPHAQHEEHLDLPDEMDIDGKDKVLTGSESDITEALSDAEESDSGPNDGDVENDDVDASETSQAGDDANVFDVDDAHLSEEISENSKDEDVEVDQDKFLQKDNEQPGQGDTIPSESQGGVMGSGQQEDFDERQGFGATDQAEQKTELEAGKQTQNATQAGRPSRNETQAQHDGHGLGTEKNEDRLDQAFKKLGDAFEKWHRQNRQLQSAQESEQDEKTNMDIDPATDLFEHLPDEDAAADTQALGTANEEEAHALDKKAMEREMSNDSVDFPPDDAGSSERDDADNQMEGIEIPQADAAEHSPNSRPTSTFIDGHQRNSLHDQRRKGSDDEADVSDIDTDLSTIHLNPNDSPLPRSSAEARQLWFYHEAQTRELSLLLTEQLRLILAPTLAAKMRGDFRTGKRLNIKRIIPYIASGYKRDKIWMRRSVPSKRSYQIMLAVDDSKSMGSSGSGDLAFKTLALVSKSLSMLEIGQICIVGFGDEVCVAHEFEQPFSSEAGANVFQHFGFQQTKTNVKSLMAESIRLFRDARVKALNSAADLWQLELIISDGVCEDHEGIRRLVRQAHEERIMVVFVIVDGVKGESIMDMTRAEFEDDGGEGGKKVKIRRYLEGFPFGYYLIVGDVKELPGVLATALRQWFAEVAESA